jgi:hypothetical protein
MKMRKKKGLRKRNSLQQSIVYSLQRMIAAVRKANRAKKWKLIN